MRPDEGIDSVDLATKKLVRTFIGFDQPISGAAFSSDGSRIGAVSGRKGRIFVWDVTSGELLLEAPADKRIPMEAISWFPDDQKIAVAGGGYHAWVVDPKTLKPTSYLESSVKVYSPGHTIDFSKDGATVFLHRSSRIIANVRHSEKRFQWAFSM